MSQAFLLSSVGGFSSAHKEVGVMAQSVHFYWYCLTGKGAMGAETELWYAERLLR